MRKIKIAFTVRLLALTAAFCAVGRVWAATEVVDGITWTYTVSNGEASVGGGSYNITAIPTSTTGAITIPSTLGGYKVKSIGSYAFYNCSKLTSVMIPDSVTSIGYYAFRGCSGLTSVTIPDSVTSVGDRAFYNCSGLTSVTIGDGVTSIGSSAFYACSKLTRVHISDLAAWCNISFSGYNSNPLYYAKNLHLDGELITELMIPDSVTSIGPYVFYNCSGLTSVNIPDCVTSIGDDAFSGCSGLTSVTIPDSVTSIGDDAFSDCSGLTSVTIGNSVTSIGSYAFSDCSKLTSVMIPDSVTNIGNYAFYNCSGLASVKLSSSLKSIGEFAFSGCSALSGIALPESVEYVGKYAFLNTKYLEDQTDGFIINGKFLLGYVGTCPGKLEIPDGVEGIGGGAFSGKNITEVEFPQSLKRICDYAFAYCKIVSLELPSGIKHIGKCAFYDGNNYGTLRKFTITDAQDLVIGSQAFYHQPVTNVTIRGNNILIGDSAFASYGYNKFGRDIAPGTISLTGSDIRVGAYAFSNWEDFYGGVDVDLSGVTSIGERAFEYLGNYYLKTNTSWRPYANSKIKFPLKIEIGANAFYWIWAADIYIESVDFLLKDDFCRETTAWHAGYPVFFIYVGEEKTLLEEIVLPNDMTEIPEGAFRKMWLQKAIIPASVKHIGAEAFSRDYAMTNMVFLGDAPTVDREAYTDAFYKTGSNYGCVVTVLEGTSGWDDDGDGKWQGFTLEWIRKFFLSLRVVENGSIVGYEKLLYNHGETVELRAVADANYACVRWEGDIEGCVVNGDTINVVMDRSRNIRPVFERVWIIPNVAIDATPAEVANVVESAGFEDPKVKDVIGGSVVEYSKFKEWVETLAGGEAEVLASPKAAVSYLLGAEVLFENEPVIELSDVEVGDSSDDSEDKGTITLSVTVKDGEDAVAVASEKVKDMFEATSSLGDWDGEAKLEPTVEPLDGDGATMRFKVKPGDGKSTSAFLRIRK